MLRALLFIALSPLSAAPLGGGRIHDAFNSWTFEALNAARSEWKPDACLASAIFWSRPGRDDPPAGHLASGEFFEFFFYSPTTNAGLAYHFLSPLQPSEAGLVDRLDSQAIKGEHRAGNAPRCISGLPITIDKAFELARKSGLTISADLIYTARRDMFPTKDFRGQYSDAVLGWNGATFSGSPDEGLSRVPRDREVWVLSSYTPGPPMPQLVSLVALDATSGRTLKVIRGTAGKAVDLRR